MRQYRYAATDATVEALHHLRGAWDAYRVERAAFTIWLADGGVVRVAVDGAEVEPDFDAFRLTATRTDDDEAADHDAWPFDAPSLDAPAARGAARRAPDFAVGRNDIVLFTGATWIEGPAGDGGADGGGSASGSPAGRPSLARGQTMQFSGSPGQLSESAAAVCLTTDALVVASPVGTGFLVRTGVQPHTIEVTDDGEAIARFLGERRYGG